MSTIYIVVSMVSLVLVALIIFYATKNKENRLTPLAGLAFVFVVAGILFGADRFIGYALMAVGVLLSLIDIVKRSRIGSV